MTRIGRSYPGNEVEVNEPPHLAELGARCPAVLGPGAESLRVELD
jgi:hypothetical protein